MRCLVFYVSAGNGHKSAAESVRNNFKSINPDAEVECLDILKCTNKIVDKFISVGYEKTIKISPYIFGKVYYHTEKTQDVIFSNVSYAVNKSMTFKLIPLINRFDPDIIISTHPFATEIISILKRKYSYRIPLVTLLTDFMPHSAWIQPQNNAYIVSNETMIDEIAKYGIKRDNIYDFGIPIREGFLKEYNREEVLKELDLDPNVFTLLVMGGTTSSSKLEKLLEVVCKLDLPMQVVAVAGGSQRLYNSFLEIQKTSQIKTTVLGFTTKIPELMKSCDAIVTKPGGLTITECLVSKIPIIIVFPIPGVEMRNKEFLLSNKLAFLVENSKEVRALMKEIIADKTILKEMRDRYSNHAHLNSAKDIYNLSVDIINEYRKVKYAKLNPVLIH